jgi:hypothetical protein
VEVLEDKHKGVIKAPETVNIQSNPPDIIMSEKQAVLVLIEGEPILREIPETKSGLFKKRDPLMHIINTQGDILFDSKREIYYLVANRIWYSTKNIQGVWEYVKKPPLKKIKKIPHDHARSRVKSAADNPSKPEGDPPVVYVRTRPTELIVTQGFPHFERIPYTGLLYTTNSQSNLFLKMDDKTYFVLLSGRWFKTDKLKGPWHSVLQGSLPDDFTKIPVDHPAGKVLVSVPGTPQAKESVLLYSMPQKATANRKKATLTVTYDGEPKFKTIQGTSMAYAVNTSYDVIRIDHRYYSCYQAFWFTAPTPNGAWVLCDKVPSVIYSIPPSCPIYHVTYVKVYDSDPDVIVYGYTSGYHGCYYYGGVVVYGTGYYYPYYVGTVYYGYPYTYGVSAYYNSYSSGYVYGRNYYTPYSTTTVRAGYNASTGVSGASYQKWSPYGQWGESVVTKGDKWAHTAHRTDDRGTISGIKTSEGGSAISMRTKEGDRATLGKKGDDVYVGKDKNVYKRNEDGWQKYDEGEWSNVDKGDKAKLQDRRENSERRNNEDREKQGQGARDRLENREGSTKLQDRERKSEKRVKTDRGSGLSDKQRKDASGNLKQNRQTESRSRSTDKNRNYLNKQHKSRTSGNQRSQNFQSFQRSSNRGSRSSVSGGRSRSSGSGGRSRSSGGSRRRR